jgi:hypothetical protein
MGDLVFTILVFIGVISVTALLFGGWLVMTLVRLVRRVLNPPRPAVLGMGQPVCPNPGCRAPSPTNARFCRRCGSRLTIGQPVAVTAARVQPGVRSHLDPV